MALFFAEALTAGFGFWWYFVSSVWFRRGAVGRFETFDPTAALQKLRVETGGHSPFRAGVEIRCVPWAVCSAAFSTIHLKASFPVYP